MQVDYEKYPMIPPGCQLNYRSEGYYQVFRETRVPIEGTNKKKTHRESVGSIRNGVFEESELFRLRREKKELEEELAKALKKEKDFEKEEFRTGQSRQKSSAVEEKLRQTIEETDLDRRCERPELIPFSFIALAALMSALNGHSDAVSIADYVLTHKEFFEKNLPAFADIQFSHDTVRRNLMIIDPERFEDFYNALMVPVVKAAYRVIAADGQAVRATGRRSREDRDLHGTRMLMNVYDTHNRVCLAHKIIDKKTNEITVGPEMLRNLDLRGAIVTADAMSCQTKFVKTVINGGANYLLSLKGNQDKSWKEVQSLFTSVHSSHIHTWEGAPELDHGRVEKRTVSIISGRFLSDPLKEKWLGLAGGCIVRVQKETCVKKTGETTLTDHYYISSLRALKASAELVGKAVRAHWAIENRLHWFLDMYWNQDQMEAGNPNYISNRSALNKLALAFLENYRYRLWETGELRFEEEKSIKLLQTRCAKPEIAIECLAMGLGLGS